MPKPKTMVSSGEIVLEHSGHVAVCCSAIGSIPSGKRERIDLPPRGTTPACVPPECAVVGDGRLALAARVWYQVFTWPEAVQENGPVEMPAMRARDLCRRYRPVARRRYVPCRLPETPRSEPRGTCPPLPI